MRNISAPKGVVKHWRRLFGEVIEPASMKVLKRSVDVTQGHS